ncbi:MAG: hypothetical protein H7A25_03560 [Leptospiraceae bacterium]|nr:hypothetical protein [Leptospiraceae bacterium]
MRYLFAVELFFLSFIISLSSCAFLQKEPGRPPKIENRPIPDEMRTLYVQNIRNNSYAGAVHVMLGRYLKEEVDRRGRFIQTRSKERARFRLYGEVVHYQEIGNLMDSANRNISAELTVIVKVELQEAGGEKIILPRNEIPARAYYSNQIGYKESEEQAQSRMLKNLAIRIISEVEEGWYNEMLRKHEQEKKINMPPSKE